MLQRLSNFSPVFCVVPPPCGAEDSRMTVNDFNDLCEVCEEVARQSTGFALRESILVERIQNKWPEFFEQYFVRVAGIGRSGRYQAIERIVEHDLGENTDWSCDVMKCCYEGRFDITKNGP
jgi:hypothetical protein